MTIVRLTTLQGRTCRILGDRGGAPVRLAARAVAALFAASWSLALAQGTVNVAGSVLGASGRHPVYVALWSEQTFLKTPAQSVRIAPGDEMHYQFTVPPGRWAVSAFEDRNDNGVLDMGLFGPKEPNGFWRAFTGHHKPRFEEVAAAVDHDVLDAHIALK
jgi:uncharacterized protein (DUF2141 family)